MEVEQMETSDIESNKLDQPIFNKNKKKVHKKISISKKLGIGAIILITFISFILLNYFNKNNNNSISIEKNDKKEKNQLNEECPPGYKVENGKCIINYSFKATYKIFNDDKIVQLISSIKPENIIEMTVENEKVKPSDKYLFPKKGKYTVYFLVDISKLDSLSRMFDGNINLESVSFTEIFNTENIIKMDNMFRNCKSLIEVDISKFNTKNVKQMDFMFFGCNSLISLDLSNFNNENLVNMNRMFFHCSSLQSINLKNFTTTKVEDMSYVFADCNNIRTLDLSSINTKNVKL